MSHAPIIRCGAFVSENKKQALFNSQRLKPQLFFLPKIHVFKKVSRREHGSRSSCLCLVHAPCNLSVCFSVIVVRASAAAAAPACRWRLPPTSYLGCKGNQYKNKRVLMEAIHKKKGETARVKALKEQVRGKRGRKSKAITRTAQFPSARQLLRGPCDEMMRDNIYIYNIYRLPYIVFAVRCGQR